MISHAFVSVGFHIFEVIRWFLFTPCVDVVQPSSYITLLSKIKLLGTGVLKNWDMLFSCSNMSQQGQRLNNLCAKLTCCNLLPCFHQEMSSCLKAQHYGETCCHKSNGNPVPSSVEGW